MGSRDRQALLDNYIKDIELRNSNYEERKDFLKNPVSFKIVNEDEEEDDMPDLESDDSDVIASAGSGGAADPVILNDERSSEENLEN